MVPLVSQRVEAQSSQAGPKVVQHVQVGLGLKPRSDFKTTIVNPSGII